MNKLFKVRTSEEIAAMGVAQRARYQRELAEHNAVNADQGAGSSSALLPPAPAPVEPEQPEPPRRRRPKPRRGVARKGKGVKRKAATKRAKASRRGARR